MAHDHGPDDNHDHHGHGNHQDRGFKAIIRYLRIAPRMWSSDVNTAMVALANPQAGETVIDIGAGMGPAVVQAAAAGATVIAVEPTPFMRTVLTLRRLLTRTSKQVQIVDGAAEALPAADASVDIVWSVNTMHHWTSVSEGAQEIARVLAPSGRVVLVDENFGDPRHPDHARWTERHGSHDPASHNHGFSMVDALEMGELITSAGLVDVIAEERDLGGVPVIAVSGRSPDAKAISS